MDLLAILVGVGLIVVAGLAEFGYFMRTAQVGSDY
jgi:hypothetical protein